MKSNLVELFNNVFPKFEDHESFEMSQLIDEIKPSLVIKCDDMMSELLDCYMQTRLRPLINSKDYYSSSKGHYVAFDSLSVEDLDKIIKRRDEDIMQREKSLQRFRKRKTEIEGQLTIVFDGIQFAGYQEVVI